MDELDEAGTDPDVAILVAYLTELRHARGLTQTDLAELAGASQPWVSELESGTIMFPRAESLARLARALGVQLSLQVRARGDGNDRQKARVALEVARELRQRGIDITVARVT